MKSAVWRKRENAVFELQSARYIATDCMQRLLQPGDRVIDATMGNGHDTLLLCQLVGETGHVDAFDIQPDAVERTRALLTEHGMLLRAELHLAGHEQIGTLVHQPIRAAMFNLGWLPGGDKSITTLWDTTRTALTACMALLLPGGVISLCVYPGHEAGDQERMALLSLLASQRPQAWTILHHKFLNAGLHAPECLLMQKNMP